MLPLAIVAAGALAAGGGIASSIIGGNAASKAAAEQAAAIREQTALQKEMFYQGRNDLTPWRTSGGEAVNALWQKIQDGPGSFAASPGYQFRLDEGNKAIERSAAAKGNVLSGATLKGLERYSQDYASNEYNNFLNQYYQSLNPYISVANMGQGAASQTAQAGQTMAGQVGNTAMSGQNALNSLTIQGANAAIGGINSVTGAANQGVNNYLLWQMMNKQPTVPTPSYGQN
jgi:hypothetical protein